MNQSPASKAIALLIDLAQKGEIDPWDVQVIEVIDRFLDELGLLNNSGINYNADLPQSGQVILWASMLVLFKADTLEKLEQEEENQGLEELEIIEGSDGKTHYLPSNLEKQIRRRTSAPPRQHRRVTLSELISQLQQIAAEIETNHNSSPPKINKKRSYSKQEAINTIAKLAHNENLTELAFQLENFLKQNLGPVVEQEKVINLESLLYHWSEHNQTESQDKVGIFWALLLLSSQSKVELEQTEFYQDLHISIV
jgi:segregation and condensation protein A